MNVSSSSVLQNVRNSLVRTVYPQETNVTLSLYVSCSYSWNFPFFMSLSQALWPQGFLLAQVSLPIAIIHPNLDLVRVSGMAYTKSRLTLKLSKCKQSGPYELLSSCCLPAPSKHIRAAFSLSGSECKRCALLLALMCC